MARDPGETSMRRAVHIGGMGKTDLLQGLRTHNVQLNPAAEALFADSRFTPQIERQVIEIASFSVADLGFEQGASYEQLVGRAIESRLVECPLELGPRLRMQFLDQM